jgi:hypothetical protein
MFLIGCLEQPQVNLNETLSVEIDLKKDNLTVGENVSLREKNLTEVNYSYVVPVNRTVVTYPIDDYHNETNVFQEIRINKIGDTNLSFYLSFSSVIGKSFKTGGLTKSLFHQESWQFLGYPLVINTYYFKIATNEHGEIENINYSIGDKITKKDNIFEVEHPGTELEDWNVKLELGSARKNYYINFTILEPIPTLDD